MHPELPTVVTGLTAPSALGSPTGSPRCASAHVDAPASAPFSAASVSRHPLQDGQPVFPSEAYPHDLMSDHDRDHAARDVHHAADGSPASNASMPLPSSVSSLSSMASDVSVDALGSPDSDVSPSMAPARHLSALLASRDDGDQHGDGAALDGHDEPAAAVSHVTPTPSGVKPAYPSAAYHSNAEDDDDDDGNAPADDADHGELSMPSAADPLDDLLDAVDMGVDPTAVMPVPMPADDLHDSETNAGFSADADADADAEPTEAPEGMRASRDSTESFHLVDSRDAAAPLSQEPGLADVLAAPPRPQADGHADALGGLSHATSEETAGAPSHEPSDDMAAFYDAPPHSADRELVTMPCPSDREYDDVSDACDNVADACDDPPKAAQSEPLEFHAEAVSPSLHDHYEATADDHDDVHKTESPVTPGDVFNLDAYGLDATDDDAVHDTADASYIFPEVEADADAGRRYEACANGLSPEQNQDDHAYNNEPLYGRDDEAVEAMPALDADPESIEGMGFYADEVESNPSADVPVPADEDEPASSPELAYDDRSAYDDEPASDDGPVYDDDPVFDGESAYPAERMMPMAHEGENPADQPENVDASDVVEQAASLPSAVSGEPSLSSNELAADDEDALQRALATETVVSADLVETMDLTEGDAGHHANRVIQTPADTHAEPHVAETDLDTENDAFTQHVERDTYTETAAMDMDAEQIAMDVSAQPSETINASEARSPEGAVPGEADSSAESPMGMRDAPSAAEVSAEEAASPREAEGLSPLMSTSSSSETDLPETIEDTPLPSHPEDGCDAARAHEMVSDASIAHQVSIPLESASMEAASEEAVLMDDESKPLNKTPIEALALEPALPVEETVNEPVVELVVEPTSPSDVGASDHCPVETLALAGPTAEAEAPASPAPRDGHVMDVMPPGTPASPATNEGAMLPLVTVTAAMPPVSALSAVSAISAPLTGPRADTDDVEPHDTTRAAVDATDGWEASGPATPAAPPHLSVAAARMLKLMNPDATADADGHPPAEATDRSRELLMGPTDAQLWDASASTSAQDAASPGAVARAFEDDAASLFDAANAAHHGTALQLLDVTQSPAQPSPQSVQRVQHVNGMSLIPHPDDDPATLCLADGTLADSPMIEGPMTDRPMAHPTGSDGPDAADDGIVAEASERQKAPNVDLQGQTADPKEEEALQPLAPSLQALAKVKTLKKALQPKLMMAEPGIAGAGKLRATASPSKPKPEVKPLFIGPTILVAQTPRAATDRSQSATRTAIMAQSGIHLAATPPLATISPRLSSRPSATTAERTTADSVTATVATASAAKAATIIKKPAAAHGATAAAASAVADGAKAPVPSFTAADMPNRSSSVPPLSKPSSEACEKFENDPSQQLSSSERSERITQKMHGLMNAIKRLAPTSDKHASIAVLPKSSTAAATNESARPTPTASKSAAVDVPALPAPVPPPTSAPMMGLSAPTAAATAAAAAATPAVPTLTPRPHVLVVPGSRSSPATVARESPRIVPTLTIDTAAAPVAIPPRSASRATPGDARMSVSPALTPRREVVAMTPRTMAAMASPRSSSIDPSALPRPSAAAAATVTATPSSSAVPASPATNRSMLQRIFRPSSALPALPLPVPSEWSSKPFAGGVVPTPAGATAAVAKAEPRLRMPVMAALPLPPTSAGAPPKPQPPSPPSPPAPVPQQPRITSVPPSPQPPVSQPSGLSQLETQKTYRRKSSIPKPQSVASEFSQELLQSPHSLFPQPSMAGKQQQQQQQRLSSLAKALGAVAAPADPGAAQGSASGLAQPHLQKLQQQQYNRLSSLPQGSLTVEPGRMHMISAPPSASQPALTSRPSHALPLTAHHCMSSLAHLPATGAQDALQHMHHQQQQQPTPNQRSMQQQQQQQQVQQMRHHRASSLPAAAGADGAAGHASLPVSPTLRQNLLKAQQLVHHRMSSLPQPRPPPGEPSAPAPTPPPVAPTPAQVGHMKRLQQVEQMRHHRTSSLPPATPAADSREAAARRQAERDHALAVARAQAQQGHAGGARPLSVMPASTGMHRASMAPAAADPRHSMMPLHHPPPVPPAHHRASMMPPPPPPPSMGPRMHPPHGMQGSHRSMAPPPHPSQSYGQGMHGGMRPASGYHHPAQHAAQGQPAASMAGGWTYAHPGMAMAPPAASASFVMTTRPPSQPPQRPHA
ncbi:hypothetical protein CXG81DRAFT_18759 [Caulochytrium protostelioides]|uniref:Uncharacterized protein n=1 Tax=Caulochytrium protostelioides TaxID=1555241 RepID=A0A4P9X861_9FUNG|nr:hypothetical protein CXG81DRAFT_18759 [Caulochytrium protostelioides]|eukprot:RKP01438.1 hypothetical protein CXG81DRAFT_18759 [Caulochytrium protostelioides]